LILLTSSQHRQKAHPNSKFQLIDREYQLVCLMAKSRTVEDYIQKHHPCIKKARLQKLSPAFKGALHA